MATVLVVDDDKQVRDMVVATLTHAGYDTITGMDGAVGAQLAEQHIPDLIITDVNMPQVDGFELLRRIRSSPSTSTIPVIFLTAESNTPSLRKGMLGGAEDYLFKPISPADLLSTVKVQLEKRSAIEQKHQTTLRLLRKNITYALPHELRTPLHSISGYANLLVMDKGKTDPSEVLEFAENIVAASARLSRLIENYLVYAQLELVHADLSELQAMRNHIVKECGAIISNTATQRAKLVKREDDLQLDVCRLALRISEADLAKIILELVDNAFKFSKPGTPVFIRSLRQDDQLIITIQDSGRGMAPEEIDMLGAYMQFGRELYEQQGLGLGFAVAKRLIELHEGAISITSQPGEGTTVSVRFSVY